ncbi:MAG: phosphopentomutase [Armatimonadota bacterium]
MTPTPGRSIIIVLDGVGVGNAPDAAEYGDSGASTLPNTARALGGLSLPHLEEMGLGNLSDIQGVSPKAHPSAAWGVMQERSKGKDTTTGHWEMAGVILDRPFPTYPHGFPPEVILEFEEAIGRKTLGNTVASGTEIIKELGAEHMATGRPIVYTSADSVFQIAAHEEIIPVPELYAMCEKARAILQGKHNVARVIARPFVGEPGNFTRTYNRKDFSLAPPPTVLDALTEAGHPVVGIGKIGDIFSYRGITESVHTEGNLDGIERTVEALGRVEGGLIFANLVDFDSKYGHRNDPQGFAQGLAEFDANLPRIRAAMRDGDLLIITADHGVDPTFPGTDHTREHVPLLVYGGRSADLGARQTFADLAATIAELFALKPWPVGKSFAGEVLR